MKYSKKVRHSIKVRRMVIPFLSGIMAINVLLQYPHFPVFVLAAFMFYLACLGQWLTDELKYHRDLTNRILKDWAHDSKFWITEMREILNRFPDASKLFVQRNENRSIWEN